MSEPLVINNWQLAIADSPYVGHGLMRNIDIESFIGAAKVQHKMLTLFPAALSTTFTAVAATDIITISAGAPSTGTAVTVSNSGGALPAGLSAATNYFVINVSPTTFKLATSVANANANTPIDLTTNGSGTNTVVTVNPGQINHSAKANSTGVIFFHDSNGLVWYLPSGGTRVFLLNGNTLTNASGQGLAVFRNSDKSAIYLFVFRNALIDVVAVTGTSQLESPSWTSGWQSLNSGSGSGNSHYALVAQDNIIYFCDDRFIGSILEKPTKVFSPSDATTYTFNNQALDMPQGEVINWLEELGVNLLGAGDTYNKVYPWDRTSSSFALPWQVPENSIKRLKNIGNTVFILAGQRGNIYKSTGYNVTLAKKVSDFLINNSGTLQSNRVTWGGIGQRNGALVFGMSTLTAGNSGVYILFPDGRLTQDNTPSTGATNVTAIYAENDFYYIGYANGADFSDTTRYSNFETVIQSQLFMVSNKIEKGEYSTLEVQIAKPAVTGHLRIGYRADTVSAFTNITTFTADSASTSFTIDAGITDIENIQFQIEMDGDIELLTINLY